jgi:hypothetical protein
MIGSHAIEEWERRVTHELYLEYNWALQSQKLSIKPAAISLFDSDVYWGKWEKLTGTISISRKLIHNYGWFHVLGVLKHEIAHQLLDEIYPLHGAEGTPHGDAFRWACQKVGVPQEFTGASTDLQSYAPDWRERKSDDTTDRLLDKVKKLLALATSSNEHESLSAMNKVRELYAKHNLEQSADKLNARCFSHLVIPQGKKRVELAKKKVVGILVGHFFVQVITFRLFDPKTGERHKAFEIIGTRENVLMAEYVYHFLQQQTAFLAGEMAKRSEKKLTPIERKSFTLGILQGFSDKLRESEKVPQGSPSENIIANALVKLQEDPALENYMAQVYPRTVSRTTSALLIDDSAFDAGISAGKGITLSKALASEEGNQGRLLENK